MVLLNDIHGGLIKLGRVCHPNHFYRPYNFNLFVYSTLTYGYNIVGRHTLNPSIDYR
jgi:hypothetical protein